ncbi:MAG: NAD(P)/FAD-dependent oxidoreductase [Patescibacteria group bacterium]|nr:NAD(P)/FAD-dependent oxidoreductase [Patescibacteria group bacterium]
MKYGVVVIGGGPAGLMAAGRAGEIGARALLLEKNKNLGRKLLITGNNRCNVTNKECFSREMINRFGKNGKFLFSVFSKFGVKETISFFENFGVKIKIEEKNRAFPESDKSQDVLNSLISYLKKHKVKIRTESEVKDIIKSGNKINKIILSSGEEIIADKFIICAGGKSYPETGSSGDGYRWAKKLGHKITKLSPSLTPIIIKEKVVKKLEGLSLKNIRINLYKDDKKIDSIFGDAIFTADGISGPAIIDLSRKISRETLKKMKFQIDFKPTFSFTEFDQEIQKSFQKNSNKIFKNGLDELLPQKLIPVIVGLSKISPMKKVNAITKEERKKLLHLFKEFDLEIKKLAGYDKAIITSGGVQLNEINPKTMKSKIIDNLYFAGEILDLDGPTGGYNLQICWSTGFMAGESSTNIE